MAELTALEIEWIQKQKAIDDYEKQIDVIKTEKENLLIAKDLEKETITAEKDTKIQTIETEIDKLK